MEKSNAQELPIPKCHDQGRIKWTSPKIVTIISEKAEVGIAAGHEGVHSGGSWLGNS
jgi:hypothetical protein